MHLLHFHVAAANAHGRDGFNLLSSATASSVSLRLGLLLLLLLHQLLRRRKLQSLLRLELLQQLEIPH